MKRRTLSFASAITLFLALTACGTSTTSAGGSSSTGASGSTSDGASSSNSGTGSASTSDAPSSTDAPASSPSPSSASSDSQDGEGGANPNGVPTAFPSPDATSKPYPKQVLPGSKTVVGSYSKDIVKSVSIDRIGAQRSWSGTSLGDAYAILKVTGAKPGLANTDFEFLDKSGKVVGTSSWNFKVGKGTDMIKVLGRTSQIPYAATSVRIHITEVSPASSFDDMNLRNVRTDGVGKYDEPMITGQYKPNSPDSFLISFTGICWDDRGNTYTASGTAPDIHAKDWTNFTVDFLSVPRGWKPSACAVGQS